MSSSTDQGEQVASSLTGDVVRQGDSGYEAARMGWNHLFSSEPSAIVFCTETGDVVNALAWARQNGVAVRVRSGRHCLEGWNAVDAGIVIDVSPMKTAEIDTAAQTATVGAGLNQSEAVAALGEAGFAAPTGIEGTVGLAGATLGGGLGPLTRAYGMASDNLVAAEIVVASADGGAEAITADEKTNPDLLWALRGAGNGNFGIVTSLTYRIHPLTQTTHIAATWTGLHDLHDVFEAWQTAAPFADNRLTSQLEMYRDRVHLFGFLVSGSVVEATRMLEPILSIGEPEVVATEADWAATYAGLQIPTSEEPANWKFHSQFVYDPFSSEAISLVEAFMTKAPTSHCNYFTNAFGGAVTSSEPSGGSVFAHRNALFYAEPGAAWGIRGGVAASADSLTAECQTWIAEFGEALAPYVNGAYVNVPNAGMPEWEAAYWGRNVDRLRAIKTKYDPENVFTFEQSVRVDD
jgi:FAD/FMN-containing dehydrogenase